jgi:bifunctional DNA-binding transcriptional regulator/antitoxin component of YhaV-PrlF toxin-antitoxin module
MNAVLSTKGQLVIPQQFRRALRFSLEGDRLVLKRSDLTPARMVKNHRGRRVLEAPEDAPPMTPETVKALLSEFP